MDVASPNAIATAISSHAVCFMILALVALVIIGALFALTVCRAYRKDVPRVLYAWAAIVRAFRFRPPSWWRRWRGK